MKKFQSGGVFDVRPTDTDLGGITPLASPQLPDLLQLNGREMYTLSQHVKSQQQALENKSLAEQRYKDAMEESMTDLNTKLFGTVHNPRQQAVIDAVKREYNIPDNFTSDILDNPILIKDMNRNLTRAMADPRLKGVIEEVATANIYRKEAATKLDPESYTGWYENLWSNYQTDTDGTFGVDQVAPALYKAAKKTNPADFRMAMKDIVVRSADSVDFNDSASIQSAEEDLAWTLYGKNPQDAIDRGLITVENDVPTLTQPAREGFHSALQNQIRANQNKADNSMEKWLTQRAIADAYADGNRRSGSSGSEDAPVDPADMLARLSALTGVELDGNDPTTTTLVEAYYDAKTGEERANIQERLGQIYKERATAPKEEMSDLEKLRAKGQAVTGALNNLQSKTSVLPQGVPPPQKPEKKYNPATGRFE